MFANALAKISVRYGSSSRLKFVVSGSVKGTLNFTPKVTLNGLRVGADSVGSVVLSAPRPFRVIGLNGLSADMDLTIPKESKPLHVLTVHVKPPTAGDYRRTLVVQTDLNNEVAVVVLEGNAQ